jgi:hypothetical protein
MKDEKDKIDFLLERNAEKQLQEVDWDKLNAAILNRLDEAKKYKVSVRKNPIVFKIAAGVAAAAAVVLIAVMIKPEKPVEIKLSDVRTALVEIVESKGSASVAIIEPSDRANATVNIAPQSEKKANCYVQIIDSSRDLKEKEDDIRPSWFIICMSKPVLSNGINRDAMDVLYLF